MRSAAAREHTYVRSENPSRAVRAFTALVLVALLMVAVTTAAQAEVVDRYVYEGPYPGASFDGSDAVGGPAPSYPTNIDIDQATEDIYVTSDDRIYKFDSGGSSQPFSALAPNTVINKSIGSYGALKVDNTGGATQGRIYAMPESSPVEGYLATGAGIGGNFPFAAPSQSCGMAVAPDGGIWVASYSHASLTRYAPNGQPSGVSVPIEGSSCGFVIDSQGNFYTPWYGGSTLHKYDSTGTLLNAAWGGENNGGENLAIDRSTGTIYVALYDHVNVIDSSGSLIATFGYKEAAKGFPGLAGAEGIAVNETTHKVYVGDPANGKIDRFSRTGPVAIPDVTTEAADFTATTATFKGFLDPDTANGGTPVTNCQFEWVQGFYPYEYTHQVPCDQATPIGSPMTVEATVGGLEPSEPYWYRLVASNANEILSIGEGMEVRPSGPPVITNDATSDVFSDGATLNGEIDAAGSKTSYHFEWGAAPCSSKECTSVPVPEAELKDELGVQPVRRILTGLTPGTTYYWRLIATNAKTTVVGSDHSFTTFSLTPQEVDSCENALVRKQTGAALLSDCRAYELVSAADTGGYDVESSLYPGQSPLAGYPEASEPARVLYTIHFGAIPGIGDPPNFGDDPYVATRGNDGWTTRYVGVPITTAPDPDAFGSSLTAADAGLATMAFGGSNFCAPCFSDGSTGVPIRLPNGQLVQGMKGSLDVADPQSAGEVRRQFSADGSNLVFGSEDKFEPAGNSGSVSIYERDLLGGGTQVVSTMPDGSTMSGEVAELDVSADGSRVLIGRWVGTDAQGNRLYDLYMHVGSDAHSILIADTADGVIYDGMTEDGSSVFFSSDEPLAGDGDTSVDLFRADVTPGSSTTSRVSTGSGGTGNTDACTPSKGWNDLGGGADCAVLGIAGGGGVAAYGGSVYFLSPELLDGTGHGTAGEPNLFAETPGNAPTFVATLDANDPLVEHAAGAADIRSTEDLQVSPSGDFAVFASRRPITGYPTNGHLEIYRHDSAQGSVQCASCAPTEARAESDAQLPHEGSALTGDGTVFFTTGEHLVLRDLNGAKTDAYEWDGQKPNLISTGTSEFDSALLSVSADGRDVYFFTQDVLSPQDQNGNLVKVYDARRGGGFYVQPPMPPCKASDECHGPGTVAPPPPDIGTYKGVGGQSEATPTKQKKRCGPGRLRRHGACVRKREPKRHTRKHDRQGRRHG